MCELGLSIHQPSCTMPYEETAIHNLVIVIVSVDTQPTIIAFRQTDSKKDNKGIEDKICDRLHISTVRLVI